MARKKPTSWMPIKKLREGDCFQMFRDPKYPEDGVRDAVFTVTTGGDVLNPGNVRLSIDPKDRGVLVRKVNCRRAKAEARRKMELRIRRGY